MCPCARFAQAADRCTGSTAEVPRGPAATAPAAETAGQKGAEEITFDCLISEERPNAF